MTHSKDPSNLQYVGDALPPSEIQTCSPQVDVDAFFKATGPNEAYKDAEPVLPAGQSGRL